MNYTVDDRLVRQAQEHLGARTPEEAIERSLIAVTEGTTASRETSGVHVDVERIADLIRSTHMAISPEELVAQREAETRAHEPAIG